MARKVVAGKKLGDLEFAVLEMLWESNGPIRPHEIIHGLPGKQKAYTTIITILTRLIDKGLVERFPDGRSYLYKASGSPDELTARAISQLLQSSKDPMAVLNHLVSDVIDKELISELEEIVSKATES